jgi:hypothetical protein
MCIGMVAEERPETIVEAFDAGINFFFLSTDMHWPLYASSRRGLAMLLARGGGIRDAIVVVATTYVAQAAFLRAPFLELVAAVPGLDRIDVCAVGGVYADDAPSRRETMCAHRDARFAGCRAVGSSFHDRALVAPACNEEAVDVAFVRYNASHPGARDDVFPLLAPSSTLLYGFKSMGGWVSAEAIKERAELPAGTWLPDPVDHYRFVLSGGGLDGVLCSPGTPAEVRSLVDAMRAGPLDADEREHMIDLALLASGGAELVDVARAPDATSEACEAT